MAHPAHTPIASPGRALAIVVGALVAAIGSLEFVVSRVIRASLPPSLHLAVFFVGFDVAIGSVLLWASFRRLAVEASSPARSDAVGPPLSVLVAAYNEVESIVPTVAALAAQANVAFEIIVADDGSTDGTLQTLVHEFALAQRPNDRFVGQTNGVRIVALALPHRGKGAALNAAAAVARHPVIVTLDADTTPAPGALAAMSRTFIDPEVDSAAGVVTVRNAKGSWLGHHQHAEYVKNATARLGWSALGALEQVPGAFTAIRTSAFFAVEGLPTDSLTEDYELTYRLIADGVPKRRAPIVVAVPSAQVFTDAPRTVRGLVRQRTRWFTGFLTTLARFRRLIGEGRAEGFGVVRLPLKLIDAALPLIAVATLVILWRAGWGAVVPTSRAALLLFAVRWAWDLSFFAAASAQSRRLGDAEASAAVRPRAWAAWTCTATEALTYVWIKHAAALRAYVWAVARVRRWEASREPLGSRGSVAPMLESTTPAE